jgi:predicted ATPase
VVDEAWPLLGRSDPLERVASAWRDARHGGALLVGDPGVGKTRLAAEVARRCAGASTQWIGATGSARSIPFGAAAHLLPDEASGDRTAVLRRTVSRLVSDARGKRLLLMVDDAHWLDDASAPWCTC